MSTKTTDPQLTRPANIEDIALIASEMGYDGVIVKNIIDMGIREEKFPESEN